MLYKMPTWDAILRRHEKGKDVVLLTHMDTKASFPYKPWNVSISYLRMPLNGWYGKNRSFTTHNQDYLLFYICNITHLCLFKGSGDYKVKTRYAVHSHRALENAAFRIGLTYVGLWTPGTTWQTWKRSLCSSTNSSIKQFCKLGNNYYGGLDI